MKFNFSTKGSQTTQNYMGGVAYRLSPEMELYTGVATCMADDSYYEKAGARLERIRELVAKCDPVFVAKLAVYARREMYLRSVPLVLVVELAKIHSGDNLVSKAVNAIVLRADEIKELLAYYQLANDRKAVKKLNRLSRQLQKGLAQSFNRFDEYQFAKYNTKSVVNLRDALFLVHPKAKDAVQQEIFDKIAAGTLATPYTWETELSELGKMQFANDAAKNEAVAAKWEELVLSNKVGYMALLRNLRNILTKGTDTAFYKALEVIIDARQIKQARQLPFRYLSAFREIEKLRAEQGWFDSEKKKTKLALQALEKALLISCDNIPVQQGRTAILSDNSGSMFGDAGGKSLLTAMSSKTTADIANLFAVMYRNKCKDAYIGLFGDRLIAPELSSKANVFENFRLINAAAKQCGGATETGIFDYLQLLIAKKKMVDRIIVFSDCQVGTGCNWYDNKGNRADSFNRLMTEYRRINPAVKIYSIDLKGYGNTMMKDNMILVGGWSERIFDMIDAVEKGVSVVAQINSIVL
jgi:hypothetical protein